VVVKRKMRLVVLAGALMTALVLATGALAGGKPPAYQGVAGSTQGLVQKGATSAPNATKTVGQLPFTGVDLALFAAGAGALIVAGLSFRRLGRREP
jgi:hypothetical protein